MFGFSTFKTGVARQCSEDSGTNPQGLDAGRMNTGELSDFLTGGWMDFAKPC
jgi:hypothetical protein